MLYAINYKGNRVSAYDANKRNKYYCPCCNEQLLLKQGDIYIHHFAHKKYTNCINEVDLTPWQYEWMCKFPEDEREFIYVSGNKKYYCHVKHKDKVILFLENSVKYEELYELSEDLLHDDLYLIVVYNMEGHYFHKTKPGRNGTYCYELDCCRLPVTIGPGNIFNTTIYFDGWSSFTCYKIAWCILKENYKVSYKHFSAWVYKKERLFDLIIND